MDQTNASVILSLRFECLKTCVEKLRVICALAGCGYQVEKDSVRGHVLPDGGGRDGVFDVKG